MHRIKHLIMITGLMLMIACIKPFNPVIEGGEANKLVVSGRITGTEGWQEVNVSMSAPVIDAAYNPVSGCEVDIRDDKGNIFALNEIRPGSYQGWIVQEYLVPGTAYMVSVVTPEGERIESAYDTLTTGASLDTVYYAIEDVPTTDPDVFLNGLQFYVDLNATESDSRNYKWEIKETWEYHSAHPLENYYDGKFHEVIPPDYSKMICWTNIMVKDVFLVSTKNNSQNVFLKFPLHFVDGHTSRLGILYSILVTQQSLSESTYNYFEVVRTNSAGFGGLYEKQPFSIKGNLVNLTTPEKDVPGYFYAATESSKRYFYKDIEGLELDFWDYCNEDPLPLSGWLGFKKYQYPVYYYYNESDALRILSDECVDCRLRGGTTNKPDFWPQ
jgi:hypothetical protein